MKLTLGTTLWARPRIEILTLGYYAKLAGEAAVDVELVCAVSEDWAERAARTLGWHIVRTPNAPLGQKHNVMLAAVRATQPDAFILIGSDDWLVAKAPLLFPLRNPFDALAAHADKPLVGLTDLWVLDLVDRRAAWWSNPPQLIGPGRMVRSDLLDEAAWKLWPDEMERGLDAPMGGALSSQSWTRLGWDDHGLGCIDFKTGVNLWSYEAFEARSLPVGFDEVLLATLPEWAKDDLRREWVDKAAVSPPTPLS
ncbi:MAG: hypothetical protein GY769_20055 [bacterium]|nr:hypothetical protein [bacterium]